MPCSPTNVEEGAFSEVWITNDTESGEVMEEGRLRTAPEAAPSHGRRSRLLGLLLAKWTYPSRSLRAPFFSLSLPFLWSERPSLFLALSPVRAPPASFMRPLALSIGALSLSSLLLFLGAFTSPPFRLGPLRVRREGARDCYAPASR